MKLCLDLTIPLSRTTLSAQIESSGVLWGLSGPSGGGKSSLLRALAGVESRALGIIDVDGTTWLDSSRKRSIPAEARRVGWAPQEALLFPHLSVRQNLTFSRRVKASPDALSEVAQLLELDNLLDRQPAHLSGGERQRVALGRALLSSPRLLLLDEPFSALDRPLRRRVIDRLSDFLARRSLPAIIVSHDQSDLAHLSFIPWEIESGCLLQHEATSLGSASEARHNLAYGSSSGDGRPR